MHIARPVTTILLSFMLAMTSACSTSPTSRPIGVAVEDTTITTKIKAALAADPDVKGRDVQVETYRGTVQLSGFVDSPENIRRAADIARRTDGVREVKNDLIVK